MNTPHLLLIGSGYLGQAVAREFQDGGWMVTAVSLSGGDASLACDVGDPAGVAGLAAKLSGRPDLIVHCASSGRGGAEAYRHVYVEGCRNLVRAFPGTPVVFTSSTSVYAQTDGSVVTEGDPAEPDRETGKLLLEAEDVILSAGGLVLRLSGIYGPGRSVILKKFLSGEARIEEDGRRILNQIHRDDAARAVFHLAAHAGKGPEIFNVSDDHPLSQLACYQRLSEIFSRPLPAAGPRDPDRKRGWTHKIVSNEKLRATGWKPDHPSFPDAARDIAGTL